MVYFNSERAMMKGQILGMLVLKDFVQENTMLSFLVVVEGDGRLAFPIVVDTSTEMYRVVRSSVPENYKIYERQARVALLSYKGKSLPSVINASWC